MLSRQIGGFGPGELPRVDPDALGSLNLSIGDKAAVTSGTEGASGTIRTSVRKGLNGMVYSVGLIMQVFIVIAPWAVILLVPTWVLIRASRKRARASVPPRTGS